MFLQTLLSQANVLANNLLVGLKLLFEIIGLYGGLISFGFALALGKNKVLTIISQEEQEKVGEIDILKEKFLCLFVVSVARITQQRVVQVLNLLLLRL